MLQEELNEQSENLEIQKEVFLEFNLIQLLGGGVLVNSR